MKLLVIGSGMYVKGSKENDHGTIIPGLLESIKKNLVDEICFVSTQSASSKDCVCKTLTLARKLKIKLKKKAIHFYPGKGLKLYQQALKNNDPDAVIVATPDHTHFEICKHIILKNKNLLVVKPLVSKSIEAKKLIDLSRGRRKIYQVEFHKRFDEANLILKKLINEKRFGTLKYCTVEYSQKNIIPKKYFKKWSSKSNSFQYLGIHYVDLIYYITGYKPKKVWAWEQTGYLKKNKINSPDCVQANIEWRKGKEKFNSYIITSWIDPNSSTSTSDQKIHFVGDKLKYFSDQKNRGVFLTEEGHGAKHLNPYFTNLFHGNELFFNGYGIKSIINFFDNIKSKKKNFNLFNKTFYDSLITTKVIEAVNQSIKFNGKMINIK